MSLYRNVLGAKVSEPEVSNHLYPLSMLYSTPLTTFRSAPQIFYCHLQPQEEHGVYTVFVEMGFGAKIELIHPLGDKSPIKNFLAKNPDGGIHHICLEVWVWLPTSCQTLKSE